MEDTQVDAVYIVVPNKHPSSRHVERSGCLCQILGVEPRSYFNPQNTIMNPSLQFGVQSYCFRHFKDNNVVARKVREIGLDRIELCRIHANFDDLNEFAKIVPIYRDEGIAIISLGVQTFTGKESEKSWFECARIAGAKHISAHFQIDTYQEAIPKVREWCREFGVRVGIHCHGGYMFGGQPDVLRYLLSLGGPEVALCIDTAWCMQIGPELGNPVQWAQEFAGKISGIHYKDFVFEKDARWKDVIVGTGNLDLPAFVTALNKGKFGGIAVIEYEDTPENPDEALRACVTSMRSLTMDLLE